MFRHICIFVLILLAAGPCSIMGSDKSTPGVSINVIEGSRETFNVAVKTIKLEAESCPLQAGSKCFFKAVGHSSSGSGRDITDESEWTSVNDGAGRFAGGEELVGEAERSVLVFAKSNNIRNGAVRIRVEPATLPALKVSPLKIDLGAVERNKSREFSVSIKNIGPGVLRWEIGSDASWLVANHDLSRDAYALWLKTWAKNISMSANGGGLTPKIKPISHRAWKAERKDMQDGLTGKETDNAVITAYTVDLPDGEYKGTVFVNSGEERKEIEVSMKVVSIEYISVIPVSINMHAGQKRSFRAAGIWSDGGRTDLSGPLDGRWVVSDPSVGEFLRGKSVFLAKKTGETEIRKIREDRVSSAARVIVEESVSQPALAVSPREIDLGAVGPGESSSGVFFLRNLGSGVVNWHADAPSGWSLSKGGKPSGIVDSKSDYIRVSCRSMREDSGEHEEAYPVRLRLESEGGFAAYVKNLPAGSRREMIKLSSDGGMRRVFLRFEIARAESAPLMEVEPLGIDAGIAEPGKRSVKRIKLRNGGRDVLKWRARLWRKDRIFAGTSLKKGRYVSFLNEKINGKRTTYTAPDRMKDSIDISGAWYEDEGFPCGYGSDAMLRYSFSGKGISVFFRKDSNGGDLLAYIDGKLVKEIDCYSEKKERAEFLIAGNLEDGEHVLKLVSREGRAVVEGARVYTENIVTDRRGWLKISPGTGTTTRETDYVNITIDPLGLKPGHYCNAILFTSNGGTAVAEVALQVPEDMAPKFLKIYRYVKETDYIYTANPELEDIDFLKGYKSEGVAFRLFDKSTPGTIPFFRWRNPSKGDFYSYERDGGGKSLNGRVFEGSIGNIATSRLSQTKELYRWFNLSSGGYFYTTDPGGEGCAKKGYRYDGIAGYVR